MKQTKNVTKILAMLSIILGVACVVSAAGITLWEASQTVNVNEPGELGVTFDGATVADMGTIGGIDLWVGESRAYVLAVTNNGDEAISVTLSYVVTGAYATVALTEAAAQTIAAGATFSYHLTFTGASAGASSIAYTIEQSA